MGKNDFNNVVIFVADSLRYDHFPEELAKKSDSEVIPTLAPSLNSPTSFTSIFTGLSAENHGVRNFMQDLDTEIPNAFDRFSEASFWDGPERYSIDKHIFRSEGKDLDQMHDDFIWIERLMETHVPYGRQTHDRSFSWSMSGLEYVEEGKKGVFDLKEEYEDGVEKAQEHILEHIRHLKETDKLDETLVIVTSDHGDALGEKYLGRKRYEHNYPPIREISQVPTVFYNYDLDVKCMRSIDIIPTALSILGKETIGNGVDVRKNEVREGRNIMETSKANFDTKWVFNGEEWEISRSSSMQRATKTVVGDLKKTVYRKAPNELKDKFNNDSGSQEEIEESLEIDI